MFERFHTFATILTIALTIAFIGAYLYQKQSYRAELAIYNHDLQAVQDELTRRAADDCVITRTDYGYACREIKSDKVFRVVLR